VTILCATDFSPCSQNATRLAVALARRFHDSVLLLHAVEPLTVQQSLDAPLLPAVWEQRLKELADDQMARVAAGIRGEGVDAETRVAFGAPAAVILDAARAVTPRLIVVGTHGRRGVAHLFLGSVAEQVVRRSEVPVLVAREDGRGIADRASGERFPIAVAADGTRASEAAFCWLAQFARANPCDVTVVRVFFPPREAVRYGVEEPWAGQRALPELAALVERDLRLQMQPTLAPLAPQVRLRAAARDTDEALVNEVSLLAPDLLVLGVPRQRPENWTALTPSAVLRRSPIPILCVPDTDSCREQHIPVTRSVLVATDLSDAAQEVVGPAYALLPNGGRVDLCYVHERGPAGPLPDLPRVLALPDRDRTEIEARLRALVPGGAEALGITTNVSVVEAPFAADGILQAAERLEADVIALASHGRSGIKRAVMGSVAEEVARRSTRPVLVARRKSKRRVSSAT
jgi:nucleotide-binding universal stress UspA family protein